MILLTTPAHRTLFFVRGVLCAVPVAYQAVHELHKTYTTDLAYRAHAEHVTGWQIAVTTLLAVAALALAAVLRRRPVRLAFLVVGCVLMVGAYGWALDGARGNGAYSCACEGG